MIYIAGGDVKRREANDKLPSPTITQVKNPHDHSCTTCSVRECQSGTTKELTNKNVRSTIQEKAEKITENSPNRTSKSVRQLKSPLPRSGAAGREPLVILAMKEWGVLSQETGVVAARLEVPKAGVSGRRRPSSYRLERHATYLYRPCPCALCTERASVSFV